MDMSATDARAGRLRPITVVKCLIVAACALFLSVGACAVAGRHTRDSNLEERFLSNESGFAALLTEVSADEKLEMLRPDKVRYAGRVFSPEDFTEMEHLGFSRQRWTRYRQQILGFGIVQITKSRGEIEFRVDQGSFWNGDSYKGYEYSLVPPAGHQKASLDAYRHLADDKLPFGGYQVYKPLKGNWYIYLFIN